MYLFIVLSFFFLNLKLSEQVQAFQILLHAIEAFKTLNLT